MQWTYWKVWQEELFDAHCSRINLPWRHLWLDRSVALNYYKHSTVCCCMAQEALSF
jgi:hypothetical protein